MVQVAWRHRRGRLRLAGSVGRASLESNGIGPRTSTWTSSASWTQRIRSPRRSGCPGAGPIGTAWRRAAKKPSRCWS